MNPMHEFIHHDDDHVEDAFQRFKKAHSKNYRDRATHEKRKHNFRHNLRLVALQWITVTYSSLNVESCLLYTEASSALEVLQKICYINLLLTYSLSYDVFIKLNWFCI